MKRHNFDLRNQRFVQKNFLDSRGFSGIPKKAENCIENTYRRTSYAQILKTSITTALPDTRKCSTETGDIPQESSVIQKNVKFKNKCEFLPKKCIPFVIFHRM